MTSAFGLALMLHIAGIVIWIGGLLATTQVLSSRERGSSVEVQGALAALSRKLLKALAHPGAAITVLAGIALLLIKPADLQQVWLHIKLTLVVILIAVDLLLTLRVRGLVSGGTSISGELTRAAIAVLFVAIIVLAVLKP